MQRDTGSIGLRSATREARGCYWRRNHCSTGRGSSSRLRSRGDDGGGKKEARTNDALLAGRRSFLAPVFRRKGGARQSQRARWPSRRRKCRVLHPGACFHFHVQSPPHPTACFSCVLPSPCSPPPHTPCDCDPAVSHHTESRRSPSPTAAPPPPPRCPTKSLAQLSASHKPPSPLLDPRAQAHSSIRDIRR